MGVGNPMGMGIVGIAIRLMMGMGIKPMGIAYISRVLKFPKLR